MAWSITNDFGVNDEPDDDDWDRPPRGYLTAFTIYLEFEGDIKEYLGKLNGAYIEAFLNAECGDAKGSSSSLRPPKVDTGGAGDDRKSHHGDHYKIDMRATLEHDSAVYREALPGEPVGSGTTMMRKCHICGEETLVKDYPKHEKKCRKLWLDDRKERQMGYESLPWNLCDPALAMERGPRLAHKDPVSLCRCTAHGFKTYDIKFLPFSWDKKGRGRGGIEKQYDVHEEEIRSASARWDHVFHELDSDHDGTLTREEIREFLERLEEDTHAKDPKVAQDSKNVLAQLHLLLGFPEHIDHKSTTMRMIDEAYDKMDVTHDHAVTLDEFRQFVTALHAPWRTPKRWMNHLAGLICRRWRSLRVCR